MRLGIPFKRMNDLPQKQYGPYKISINLWEEIYRLAKKSASKDECKELLGKLNARQQTDIHRAIGCSGNTGKKEIMVSRITDKLIVMHNKLLQSGNISEDGDDDKSEELISIRGNQTFNWLLNDYKIGPKNQIFCDDIPDDNIWKYVRVKNKQNTLIYPCQYYMFKIINKRTHQQIGLTFLNPAVERYFLETAVCCKDEHAPELWPQFNKRCLAKFDKKAYPGGNLLNDAAAQNAMNKLKRMGYKPKHFKHN